MSGAGKAQFLGCAEGPDIEGTVTWTRAGTAVTFDGDFTCGNEPKFTRREPCVFVLGRNGLWEFVCILTPVDVAG